MNRCIPGVVLIILFLSCSKSHKTINRFADSTYVRIAKFQDERNSAQLTKYLSASDPDQRTQAALAFASVQDSSAVEQLGKMLLTDPDPAARKAAAFAIGQTRCSLSEKILLEASSKEKDTQILAEIVEGYGKVLMHWNLNIARTDTIVDAGLAWSIYQAGLIGKADKALNEIATQLLASPSESVRLGAAHYFSRSAKDFNKDAALLIHVASTDNSEDVRMAAVYALRKIQTNGVIGELTKMSAEDASYRVRVNAIRALGAFPISKSKTSLIRAVQEDEVNVAIQASEVLLKYDTAGLWSTLLPLARSAKNWRVQANLYDATLKGSRSPDVQKEIVSLYRSSANPYQKGALLNALSSSMASFEFIDNELFSTSDHAIKTAAASAIVSMNHCKSFVAKLKPIFADVYIKGITTADVGLVSLFGAALADPEMNYRSIVKDTAFLYSTRKKLKLPVDNEALQSLDILIAYFESKAIEKPFNAYNHPIDWNHVSEIPSNQHATLRTDKGDIVIRLLVDEAPGSVVNFVSLARSKYFDGKNFHRVVPNFVAQGGCNRGDGYGGEDYSIRSEFSQRKYTTGSIGMASAGKDTEGTQWFITHSPTPHLDGKYTIFAVVESGMDIVHKLEIGDKIIGITFSN